MSVRYAVSPSKPSPYRNLKKAFKGGENKLSTTWDLKDLILNFKYLLIDGSDVLVRICKLESFRTSYDWSYVYRTDIAFLRKPYFVSFVRQTQMLKPVNELSVRVLMQLNELTRCLSYLETISTGQL